MGAPIGVPGQHIARKRLPVGRDRLDARRRRGCRRRGPNSAFRVAVSSWPAGIAPRRPGQDGRKRSAEGNVNQSSGSFSPKVYPGRTYLGADRTHVQ